MSFDLPHSPDEPSAPRDQAVCDRVAHGMPNDVGMVNRSGALIEIAETAAPIAEANEKTTAQTQQERGQAAALQGELAKLEFGHPVLDSAPLLPLREPLAARLAGVMGKHHLLLFVLSVLLLWTITSLPSWQRDTLKSGQVATRDILAPHAAMLLDRRETEARREAAAALVPPVYDPDPSAQPRALNQLRALINTSREATAVPTPNVAPAATPLSSATRQRAVQARLRTNWESPLPPQLVASLARVGPNEWGIVERAARAGVDAVYVRGQVRSDVDDDVKSARTRIEKAVAAMENTLPLSARGRAAAMEAARYVARRPNLVVDDRATSKARQAAREDVRDVYLQIPASAPIVRAGETISEEKWAQLQDLDIVSPRLNWRTSLSRALLCFALVALSAGFIARFDKRLFNDPTQLWLTSAIPLLFLLVFRMALRIPHADSAAIPLASTAAMLLTVLLSARVGILGGFSVAAVCAVMANSDVGLFLASVLSAWVGALGVASLSSRGHLVRAGAALALCSAVLLAMVGLMREIALDDVLSMAIWGGASGVIATLAMAGLAMFLERPFGITTHLRLLELLSPDENVIQRMQGEAPGTYTHSMMVANLSEAAAKAIGDADPLLCRVGGIYHDIGKLHRPQCFIENQSGENIHDQLTPQLSALVIMAHVKDGLELGRALRLPRPVLDIIAQHHGTSLHAFFYARALQQARENDENATVDERLFRYAGPRPQSKEAAIVMLADTVEASSRVLSDPTPERLQAHISSMVSQRLREDELSDCDLTLRDLQTIENSFARVLRGVLHQRIAYPKIEGESSVENATETVETLVETQPRRSARARSKRRKAAPTNENASASTCSAQKSHHNGQSQSGHNENVASAARPRRQPLRFRAGRVETRATEAETKPQSNGAAANQRQQKPAGAARRGDSLS